MIKIIAANKITPTLAPVAKTVIANNSNKWIIYIITALVVILILFILNNREKKGRIRTTIT